MSDSLSKVFGIGPLRENLPSTPVEDKELGDDASEARKNLKVLIETGNRALEEALNLAIESESPRAYEVLTNLITTIANLNAQIVEVHGKEGDIKRKAQQPAKQVVGQLGDQSVPGQVVNNTVFVGTTSGLSDFLQQLNKPKPINQDIIDNEPKQN